MTQRIVNEEITRARHLMGYNVGLTLNEQTTGLMGVTMNTCTGGTVPPDGNSYAMQYAITINGNNPTQADIGKTIISSSYYLGYLHGTVTSVFPASIQQGTIAHAFTEQPCTGTTGGTVTCYGCDAINGAGGSTTVTSQQFQNNQLSNPYMMLGATQSYCGSWPTTFFTDQAAVIAQCQSGTTGGGCANITYNADCGDNAGGANNTQHNDGCSTIDGNMPDSTHVGSYITRPNSPNIFKVISIGDQNTTSNGHSYTSAACTGGPTPGPTQPQFEEPCEEFSMWDRIEQRDFCKRCRRAPDNPMCKCCTDR